MQNLTSTRRILYRYSFIIIYFISDGRSLEQIKARIVICSNCGEVVGQSDNERGVNSYGSSEGWYVTIGPGHVVNLVCDFGHLECLIGGEGGGVQSAFFVFQADGELGNRSPLDVYDVSVIVVHIVGSGEVNVLICGQHHTDAG